MLPFKGVFNSCDNEDKSNDLYCILSSNFILRFCDVISDIRNINEWFLF